MIYFQHNIPEKLKMNDEIHFLCGYDPHYIKSVPVFNIIRKGKIGHVVEYQVDSNGFSNFQERVFSLEEALEKINKYDETLITWKSNESK